MCVCKIFTPRPLRAHTLHMMYIHTYIIYNIIYTHAGIRYIPVYSILQCIGTRVTTRCVGSVNDLTDVWLGRP